MGSRVGCFRSVYHVLLLLHSLLWRLAGHSPWPVRMLCARPGLGKAGLVRLGRQAAPLFALDALHPEDGIRRRNRRRGDFIIISGGDSAG